MREGIFLLLGSNINDPLKNLETAKNEIMKVIGPIIKKSSIYKTAPWGKTDQPPFLNQVIRVETELEPFALLARTLAIEKQMGRIRKEKWGERAIDIDILFYNQEWIHSDGLSVPHPGIPARRFTLEPLNEIAPDFHHPVLQKKISDLLSTCDDHAAVEKTDL